MGLISELIDLTKLVKDSNINTEELMSRMASKQSIAKMTKDAILQFPVLVSNTLSLDTVTTLNKALERQYSSFVMVATDLISVQKNGRDATAFLRFIHQNTMPGSPANYHIEKTGIQQTFYNSVMKEDMQLCEDMNDFKYKSLGLRQESANSASLKTRMNILTEAKDEEDKNFEREKIQTKFENDVELARMKSTADLASSKMKENYKKATNQDFTAKLKDNDVKKSNELVPTLLEVTLQFRDPGSDAVIKQTFTIGIKTVCHPVSSDDIIYNVSQAFTGKKLFLKFIRWTTGEIKFFRDFLFNIDTIKKNIMQERKQVPWWSALRNRATYNRTIANLFKDSKLLPNATIVLTTDEAEVIKSTTGIDIFKDSGRVQKVMQDLSLLGLVIVNESSEVAWFKFDGDTKWYNYGFNSLERENKNPNNDVKALLSLLK